MNTSITIRVETVQEAVGRTFGTLSHNHAVLTSRVRELEQQNLGAGLDAARFREQRDAVVARMQRCELLQGMCDVSDRDIMQLGVDDYALVWGGVEKLAAYPARTANYTTLIGDGPWAVLLVDGNTGEPIQRTQTSYTLRANAERHAREWARDLGAVYRDPDTPVVETNKEAQR